MERVAIVGEVVYDIQWSIYFIFTHYKFYVNSSIRYKISLSKNVFSNVMKYKEIQKPSIVFLSIYQLIHL